jgi:hypothetical protein
MATKIEKKISNLTTQRTKVVEQIRELKAQLRKAGVPDAEAKRINTEINRLTDERVELETEANDLTSASKDAKEYTKLNQDIKKLQDKIEAAENRGVDTVLDREKRAELTQRLQQISPKVERLFPEIKVDAPDLKITTRGPGAAKRAGKLATTPSDGTPTPAPTPTPVAADGTNTKIKGTKTSGDGKKVAPEEDKKVKGKALTIDEIIDEVARNYGSIDSIFKTNEDLQALLRRAIGKDGVPNTDDDLTPDQFVKELENTNWFKQNAGPVRQRGFYKRQFDDLVKSGADEEELYQTSEYGRGLEYTKQIIENEAVRLGVVLDATDLDLIARDIYDLGNETKPAIIQQRIRSKITYKPGGSLSGAAGENIAELRKVAAANGLDLEKNFGSSLQGWLQKLAQGESIETYKQIVRGAAKLGLPEKVASLIDQGVDLDTIYKPYKDIMSAVLEINPSTITVNDKVLRSAIGPDREMSLYDFQKMLRKDDRWQYTNQAKEEVSGMALNVLRDFGFQG